MSIFIPYSPSIVLDYLTNLYSLDLTSLSDYQSILLTLGANLYFLVFWFIVIYFALKIFNSIYESIF